MIQRVVVVERVGHAGVQRRSLRRGEAGVQQQGVALLPPAPSPGQAQHLGDARLGAAAEQAAERIAEILLGPLDCQQRQVGELRAARVGSQGAGGVLGHRFLLRSGTVSQVAASLEDGQAALQVGNEVGRILKTDMDADAEATEVAAASWCGPMSGWDWRHEAS